METEEFRRLGRLAEEATETTRKLRAAVVAAAAEAQRGELPLIAEAAGISLATLHRWRHQAGADATDDPIHNLHDGLLALLEAGAGPAHMLHAGLGSRDPVVAARRFELGMRNLARMPDDPELRARLSSGSLAAAEALRKVKRRAT